MRMISPEVLPCLATSSTLQLPHVRVIFALRPTDVAASQRACQGPKLVRRSRDIQPFSFPYSAKGGRKLEWQGRRQLHRPLRVRTTRLSWHACSAPVGVHLYGTVRPTGNICLVQLVRAPNPRLLILGLHGSIFWAFDLLPAADGSTIDPTKTINLGQTREPAPFQFRVCVRHPEVEHMIGIESAGADLRLKEWEY